MTATATMIEKVRRMVNEPENTTYSDATLSVIIETYPLVDARGVEPYTWDTSTEPPTKDANDNWIVTYDLNAAAADIWEEKAALVAQDFDFKADGGGYTRSQVYDQFMKLADNYRSKRSVTTISQEAYPYEKGADILFNVNDPTA